MRAIETALLAIFVDGRYAEKLVPDYLKNQRKWGSRDRRFFAETVYNVVRWWRMLLALEGVTLGDVSNLQGSETSPNQKVDAQLVSKVLELYLAWSEDPKPYHERISQLKRSERESIPDWLDQLGEKEFGIKSSNSTSNQIPNWPELLHSLNRQAPQVLRANTLKTDVATLQKKLREEGVETKFLRDGRLQKLNGGEADKDLQTPDALVLLERKNVFQTQAFKSGFFEMQDGGSQLVAPLLGALPGERVIDACAGAGGKTLHLAAMMKNKGKIIALDIHQSKLDQLKLRARRAGATSIEMKVVDSSKVIKRMEKSADRVLLDVPCSGLGVLRRNPDTKWKLTPGEIEHLREQQADILRRYSMMTKPGGLLVYATCSVLPSENQEQVAGFLKSAEGQFVLEKEISVNPATSAYDGFYAARLRRQD